MFLPKTYSGWFHDDGASLKAPIDDSFPCQCLLDVSMTSVLWYADLTNYLTTGIIPNGYSPQQKKKFFYDVKRHFLEDPFLYRLCVDGVIRRCVPQEEVPSIISHCHDLPCGGHASASKTAAKIIHYEFYWPSLFKETHAYAKSCDRCQRTRNISRSNEPLNNILEIKVFDVWRVDFMGSFPSSYGNRYILLAVEYVSK